MSCSIRHPKETVLFGNLYLKVGSIFLSAVAKLLVYLVVGLTNTGIIRAGGAKPINIIFGMNTKVELGNLKTIASRVV
jgi:hypothetical protein